MTTTLRPEQISTAQKAGVDSFFNLANTLFGGVEKVIELNLQTARAALAETSANTRQDHAREGPQRMVRGSGHRAGPYAEQVQSYGDTFWRSHRPLRRNFSSSLKPVTKSITGGYRSLSTT
ncbi:MAG: phasin family protein [Paraburkholderia sp.]|uniref:phasin family protein n=1 Tax=Paraburkholderia sp. TaxID=1926495 RepID=UPI003C40F541